MQLPLLLLVQGVLLIWAGSQLGYAGLALAWLGLNFLAISFAHYLRKPGVHGKARDGRLPMWSWMLFLPYYLITHLVWHLARWISRAPASHRIHVELSVGRRLLAGEFAGGFANIVDLTAEFSEPAAIRKPLGYQCLPILDGSAPDPDTLHSIISALKPGPIWVHCAQGFGRTGLFALALLLHFRKVQTIAEGLHLLAKSRPGIALNSLQMRCILAWSQRYLHVEPELCSPRVEGGARP